MMMMMMMMMMMFITQQRHVMSRDMPDDFAFRLCYVNVVINCLCRCAPYIPSILGYKSGRGRSFNSKSQLYYG